MLLAQALSAKQEAKDADTLYVWAQSGLRVRDRPSPDGEILEKLTFGSIVHLLEKVDSNSVPYEVIAETTMKEWEEKPLKKGVFKLKGHWVKVGYGKKTGYVFDQYLSRLKPGTEKDMRKHESKFSYCAMELVFMYINFGQRFKNSVINKVKLGQPIDVYSFGDGAKFESQGHEGGGWGTITLPKGYTFAEGYLVAEFLFGDRGAELFSSKPNELIFKSENNETVISMKNGVVTISHDSWC